MYLYMDCKMFFKFKKGVRKQNQRTLTCSVPFIFWVKMPYSQRIPYPQLNNRVLNRMHTICDVSHSNVDCLKGCFKRKKTKNRKNKNRKNKTGWGGPDWSDIRGAEAPHHGSWTLFWHERALQKGYGLDIMTVQVKKSMFYQFIWVLEAKVRSK